MVLEILSGIAVVVNTVGKVLVLLSKYKVIQIDIENKDDKCQLEFDATSYKCENIDPIPQNVECGKTKSM